LAKGVKQVMILQCNNVKKYTAVYTKSRLMIELA
jgi:hypothetical protein